MEPTERCALSYRPYQGRASLSMRCRQKLGVGPSVALGDMTL